MSGRTDRLCSTEKSLGIFLEIGMDNMEYYEKDFESAMLEDTVAYYFRKASSWIMEDSCPNYMLKVEECLKLEKEIFIHYLHADSKKNLIGKVEHELLSQYENQLMEKEHSGYHALLKDGKVTSLNDVKASGNWMYVAKLDGEGASMYDVANSLRDAMIELGIAIDGGKDSISMAA